MKSCVECIVSEAKKGHKERLLNSIDKKDKPLVTYDLDLDYVGPIEATRRRNRIIF